MPVGIDRVGAVAVAVAAGSPTAWKVLAVLSTSVSVRVPVAVGVPAMALADAAGLDHRALDVAGDHRRVVGAVDGDGQRCGSSRP